MVLLWVMDLPCSRKRVAKENWCEVMIEEMASIEQNNMWMLVNLPLGHH
jgi:hypothetical protein